MYFLFEILYKILNAEAYLESIMTKLCSFHFRTCVIMVFHNFPSLIALSNIISLSFLIHVLSTIVKLFLFPFTLSLLPFICPVNHTFSKISLLIMSHKSNWNSYVAMLNAGVNLLKLL